MKNCVIFEIIDAYGRGISPYRPPTEFFITVNNSPLWCEDIIFATFTFHMSMESSFETQFTVVLLKTDPEHHFPDHHSFKLSNRTDIHVYRDTYLLKSGLGARLREAPTPGPCPMTHEHDA